MELRSDQELNAVTIGERMPHNAPILLSEYNPQWPLLYQKEEARLRDVLGKEVMLLEHVGSTSVPGLCAKPILDILLVVPDPSQEETYLPLLQEAGYTLRIREPDWYQHRMCLGPETPLHLHIFGPYTPEIDRMVRFRDWLRTHDSDRDLYAEAKRQLAKKTWRHVQHYADAKTFVIEQILSRANQR